jgi:ketosteroid isomerase-like protein
MNSASGTATTTASFDLRARIDAFLAAFNENDLDAVMTFFSDEAVYRPGDGREHRGPAAIRKAFEPQFAGVYGKMRFDETDRVVDESARKLTLCWVCRFDMHGSYAARVPRLLRPLYRALARGERGGFNGLDVFHFDESGMIRGKFSFTDAIFPRLDAKYGEPI